MAYKPTPTTNAGGKGKGAKAPTPAPLVFELTLAAPVSCAAFTGKTANAMTAKGTPDFRAFNMKGQSLFYFRNITVKGFQGLERLLRLLAHNGGLFVIRAKLKDGKNPRTPHYRRWNNAAVETNDLEPRLSPWLALDIDAATVPAPLGLGENLRPAAAYLRKHVLPEAFKNATMVVCATAGSGWQGEATARMRLWFAVANPVPDADAEAWCDEYSAVTGVTLDGSTCRPVQPIFCSRARFEGELADPIAENDWVFLVPGSTETVTVDWLQYRARAEEILAAETAARFAQRALANGGSGWLSPSADGAVQGDLVEKTRAEIQTTGAVRLPLLRMTGRAVADGKSDAEIQDACAQLLSELGDERQLNEYGPQYIARTIAYARAGTNAQRVRAQAAQTRLQQFTERAAKRAGEVTTNV
jgi:hypothetical protein